MGGVGEGRLGLGLVAVDRGEADVVLAVVPDQRRAGLGGVGGGDRGRQRLVVDLDQFGGVHRLVLGLGDDEGDIVADEAHAVLHQRRIARLVVGRAVAALVRAGHRQVAPAGLDPVLAGQHAEHARRGLGLGRVDRLDLGVGVRRAQHMPERHARQHDVVDILAAAAQQPRILEPRHALTDRKLTHCSPRIAFRPADIFRRGGTSSTNLHGFAPPGKLLASCKARAERCNTWRSRMRVLLLALALAAACRPGARRRIIRRARSC